MKVLLIQRKPAPARMHLYSPEGDGKDAERSRNRNRDIPHRRKGDTGLHGLRRVRRRQALRVR